MAKSLQVTPHLGGVDVFERLDCFHFQFHHNRVRNDEVEAVETDLFSGVNNRDFFLISKRNSLALQLHT